MSEGALVGGREKEEGRAAYTTSEDGELNEGGVVGAGAGVDGTEVVAEDVGDVARVGGLHDELSKRVRRQIGARSRREEERKRRTLTAMPLRILTFWCMTLGFMKHSLRVATAMT